MNALKSILLLIAATPSGASACAVCMGDPNSYLASASNGVFWMLLGLVGFMFISTGLTALYIWRCSKAPIPEHVQFVESLTAEPEEI